MRPRALILLMATSLLGGCYSFYGPAPVVNSYAVVSQDTLRARHGDYYERFRQAATRASGCRPSGPTETRPAVLECPVVPGDDNDELLRNYMRAGFLLVLTECDDYFAHMARNHGRSRILRDSITPIANLITGIVALSGTTAGGIPELALATGAAGATLDIVDQRFLFGTDNIASVRQLVFRALSAQSRAALGREGLSFEDATSELVEYHEICTPAQILALTRQSIQRAVPTATPPPSDPKPGTGTAPPAGQGMSTTSVSIPEQPR